MTEFLAALKKAYDDSAELRAAFPGGLWADIAPENTPFPYLVYNVPSCPVTYGYEGVLGYRPTIRYTAYGSKDDCGPGNEAFALVDSVLAENLEVPGRQVDWYLPGGKPLARYVGKSNKGGDLWQTTATYDYSVS